MNEHIKNTLFICGLAFVLVLIIIGVTSKREADKTHTILNSYIDTISVFTDPDTGCEYLLTHHAIFPRLNTSGEQICETTKKKKK